MQEQARVTLMRWLALDPLTEEASRRLMRLHLALGDPTAALRVYATCRARLAEELRVEPSTETVALAEYIRTTAVRSGGSPARPAAPPERRLSKEAQSARSSGEKREQDQTRTDDEGALSSSELEIELAAMGDFLFAQTDGQPLYLLETLKLFRDRHWLVPRSNTDGALRLELAVELATIVSQDRSQGALLPPSVRALILERLAPRSQSARHLMQVSAVLGIAANAKLLWQLAELEVQAGIEALEEAVSSGILREEEAGVGRPGSYRFSHDLMRDVVYTELGAARRQVLHQRALAKLEAEGARASALAYHARSSGEAEAAYGYSVQAGMEDVAIFAVEDAIGHYEQARALLLEHQSLQSELSAGLHDPQSPGAPGTPRVVRQDKSALSWRKPGK